MVTALLIEYAIPSHFLCEALSIAVHLINQLSSALDNASRFYKLFRHDLTYSHLRPFGYICFVHLPPNERTKLTPQIVRCAFLSYGRAKKGYVCYDPKRQRIRISHNVVFFGKTIVLHFGNCCFSSCVLCLVGFLYKILSIRAESSKHLQACCIRSLATDDYFPKPSRFSTYDSDPLPDNLLHPVPLSRTSCIPRPPYRYGFSTHSSTSTILNSIFIPYSNRRAIEHDCWQ